MANLFKDPRPKSFIIALAAYELLSGTLLSINPEIFYTRILQHFDLEVLSILYLTGSTSLLLHLELKKNNSKFALLTLFPPVLPLLYLILKLLPYGNLVPTVTAMVLILGIIISAKISSQNNNQIKPSLLIIISGLLSIILGLVIIVLPSYSHPLLLKISAFFPLISLTLIIFGFLTLKTSNSLIPIITLLPILFLGIYFAIERGFFSAFTFIIIYLTIFLRSVFKIFLPSIEDEEAAAEHQFLHSYNKILNFAALGSLFAFILANHAGIFKDSNKILTSVLILIFALATIIWFNILPHKMLSKKQIFLWLNLYTLFIVVITFNQTNIIFNPLMLFFVIPIFIAGQLFPLKLLIAPLWFALAGITLSLVAALIQNGSFLPILTKAATAYLLIIFLTYFSRKITQ